MTRSSLFALLLTAAFAGPVVAQQLAPAAQPALPPQRAPYEQLAPAQAVANKQPGLRRAPQHDYVVPTAEVSPQNQSLIARPYSPVFNIAAADCRRTA